MLIYGFLMITNIIWLASSIRGSVTREKLGVEEESISPLIALATELVKYRRRDFAPHFWIKNNIVAFVLLSILYVAYTRVELLSQMTYIVISIGVCLLNSIADFIGTWYFYFPKFDEIYRKGIEASASLHNNLHQHSGKERPTTES